jgi:hypothetical protein
MTITTGISPRAPSAAAEHRPFQAYSAFMNISLSIFPWSNYVSSAVSNAFVHELGNASIAHY